MFDFKSQKSDVNTYYSRIKVRISHSPFYIYLLTFGIRHRVIRYVFL